MRRVLLLMTLLLLLLTAVPTWASGACCPAGPERGAAVGRFVTQASQASWSVTPFLDQDSGCPCCPTGDDCTNARCCGTASSGAALANLQPFRVVLRPAAGAPRGPDCGPLTRAIARDVRPPIAPLR